MTACLRELCSWTGRQTDNPIFYKAETYLDYLLMSEIFVITNFVKIVRVVLENVNCILEQTDNPIFYKVETYLDRFLVSEIYVILNSVKIIREVVENVN